MTVEEVYVPFKPTNPKTRLSPLLDYEERTELSHAMLHDVCTAIQESGHEPIVVSTQQTEIPYKVIVKPEPLTPAVNEILGTRDPPVAVVMADLALATPDELHRLLTLEGELVLVPGLGGGTNAFVTRNKGFRVDYHGTSFKDHREIASEEGIETEILYSYRLGIDIDTPSDLVEALIHAEGRTYDYLNERFKLSIEGGRVSTERK